MKCRASSKHPFFSFSSSHVADGRVCIACTCVHVFMLYITRACVYVRVWCCVCCTPYFSVRFLTTIVSSVVGRVVGRGGGDGGRRNVWKGGSKRCIDFSNFFLFFFGGESFPPFFTYQYCVLRACLCVCMRVHACAYVPRSLSADVCMCFLRIHFFKIHSLYKFFMQRCRMPKFLKCTLSLSLCLSISVCLSPFRVCAL